MAERGNAHWKPPSLWVPTLATGTAILAQCTALLAIASLALAPTRSVPFVSAIFMVAAAGFFAGCAVLWWVRYFRGYLQGLVQQRVQEVLAEAEQRLERTL
jgi:hypothetical protein